jgi:uncharacterized protein (TIGR02646 family)
MIRIERGTPPEQLLSPEVRRQYEDAAAYYRLPPEQRGQRRAQFTGPHTSVKAALGEMFQHKCAYCESAVDRLNVDLFRPHSNATGARGTSPDHYWWLAWEWRNMYLVCTECTRAKASAFPVEGPRAPPEIPYDKIVGIERALLLDPCGDDPESLLVFEESGRVVTADFRAMTTIDLLHLNRPSLVRRRRQALENTRGRLAGVEGLLRARSEATRSDLGSGPDDAPERILLQMIDAANPFAGVRRQVVRTWFGERGDWVIRDTRLRAFFNSAHPRATPHRLESAHQAYARFLQEREQATLDDAPDDRLYMKTRFIESIELYNIRGIRHLELHTRTLDAGRAPCLAILGENGTGKSTILQSVALALIGPKERERLRLRPSYFLRSGASEGFVRVRLTGSEEPFTVRMRQGEPDFLEDRSGSQVQVMAYGPTRLLPNRGSGKLRSRTSRVDNLFNPRAALTSAANWLGGLPDPDWFRRSASDLRRLLPIDDGEIVRGPPLRVRLGEELVPFNHLSAGYQAILALATDVMRFGAWQWGALSGGELSATTRGILIVDEIDAHLHPRWKMRVLHDLRHLFPEVQLLVTSHDPLVLRSLERGEVAVLERGARGEVYAEVDLPSPKALRVDQILTSEFFGLASTRDPETDKDLREYQRLLAHPPSALRDARIRELENRLDANELLGSDPRERLLLRAADAYLGRHRDLLGSPVKRDAENEIDQMLQEIWERSGKDDR